MDTILSPETKPSVIPGSKHVYLTFRPYHHQTLYSVIYSDSFPCTLFSSPLQPHHCCYGGAVVMSYWVCWALKLKLVLRTWSLNSDAATQLVMSRLTVLTAAEKTANMFPLCESVGLFLVSEFSAWRWTLTAKCDLIKTNTYWLL